MTLRDYEIFVAVCREMSITAASQHLRISQPAISNTIKRLEEHYGEPLFARISRKLYITPFGMSIYNQSLEALNSYSTLYNAKEKVQSIHIGSGTAIGKLFLSKTIRAFSELHPDVKFTVNVGDAARMYNLVMENKLDFALAETVAPIPGLNHFVLQVHPVVAACHRENPLASIPVVAPDDLAGQPLLLREKGSFTRYIVETYFQSHNLPCIPAWESGSVQTLLNAVNEGLGVTFLSIDHIMAVENPNIVILNVPDFHMDRHVNVGYHKNKLFTPIMEEFICFYQDYTEKFLEQKISVYNERHRNMPYNFPSTINLKPDFPGPAGISGEKERK